MSADQSVLVHYGYDAVVALSQVGVNDALKSIRAAREAPIRYLGLFTGDVQPLLLTLDQLQQRTNGVDPFDIASGSNSNDSPQVSALVSCGLQFVVAAQAGSYALPRDEAEIVSFTRPGNAVSFGVFQRRFVIGQVVPPTQEGAGFVWQTQSPSPREPWFFTVRSQVVTLPLPDPDQWPPAVQQEASKYASCTVTLVAFDLAGAAPLTFPAIPGTGPQSPIGRALTGTLLPALAQDTVGLGANVIGYWIQPSPASLSVVTAMAPLAAPFLTAWNGSWTDPPPQPIADPTIDQANAAALNLLCSINNDPPPVARLLRWNWFQPVDTQQYQGLIAVSFETLVTSFRQQLEHQVFLSCWSPIVDLSPGNTAITVNQGTGAGNFNVTTIPGGIQFAFSASASASTSEVDVTLQTDFQMAIGLIPAQSGAPATIEILQNEVFQLQVSIHSNTYGSHFCTADIVSDLILQKLPLGISETGQIVVQSDVPSPIEIKSGETLNVVQYDLDLEWLQEAIDDLQLDDNFKSLVRPHLVDPSILSGFFFPFGEAFSFADVGFSAAGDMIGHITFLA